jgi:outer membrane protein W
MLLKYHFAAKGPVRPYVDAGISFDRLQGLTESITTAVIKTNSGAVGGVIGGGLDIHFLLLHISPEIRYTRWTSQHFNLTNVLSSNQNQAEFLVGVTF